MADRLFVPSRADVWLADLDHIRIDSDGRPLLDENGDLRYTRHREHGGKRPCVVMSNREFNEGPAELVIVVPMTSVLKGTATHVPIRPPEGGLREHTFAICEGIRSIDRHFLVRKWGRVEDVTMREIELILRRLMDFSKPASGPP